MVKKQSMDNLLTFSIQGVLIATSYTLAGIVSYACYYAPYGQFQWRFRESLSRVLGRYSIVKR